VTKTTLTASGLRRSLRQRHMTMIALGGVIGAGLFVGSGVVIEQAGPAAVISFVITGMLVVLVMRMLGEMAVALPAVGSFYEYARLAWSDRPAWENRNVSKASLSRGSSS
jgi:GABA permease